MTKRSLAAGFRTRRKPPDAASQNRAETNGIPATTSLDSLLDQGSDSPFRELIYELISLANLMRTNQEHFAAYIGVSAPQYVMMSILADRPGTTVARMASRVEVSSQFVTVQIGKLVSEGLVEKLANERDRRSVLLQLTSRGRMLMRELAPLRREINDRMFRSLTAGEAVLLRDIVTRLLADGRSALHEIDGPHRRGERAPSLAGDGPFKSGVVSTRERGTSRGSRARR